MSVHREGDNPNSMDGVSDLRDHKSFNPLLHNVSPGVFLVDRTSKKEI